MTFKLLVLKYW